MGLKVAFWHVLKHDISHLPETCIFSAIFRNLSYNISLSGKIGALQLGKEGAAWAKRGLKWARRGPDLSKRGSIWAKRSFAWAKRGLPGKRGASNGQIGAAQAQLPLRYTVSCRNALYHDGLKAVLSIKL